MTCQLNLLLVLLPVSRPECTHNCLDNVPVLEFISTVNCVTERKTASHKAASALMRRFGLWGTFPYGACLKVSTGQTRHGCHLKMMVEAGRFHVTEAKRLSPIYTCAAGSRPTQRDKPVIEKIRIVVWMVYVGKSVNRHLQYWVPDDAPCLWLGAGPELCNTGW